MYKCMSCVPGFSFYSHTLKCIFGGTSCGPMRLGGEQTPQHGIDNKRPSGVMRYNSSTQLGAGGTAKAPAVAAAPELSTEERRDLVKRTMSKRFRIGANRGSLDGSEVVTLDHPYMLNPDHTPRMCWDFLVVFPMLTYVVHPWVTLYGVEQGLTPRKSAYPKRHVCMYR